MTPSAPTPGRTDRTWIALCALFVLSLPLVTPRIYASDEIEYFAYLRSLWFDHDLSFDNEYRYFHDHVRPPGFYETFIEPTTPTGLRRTFAPIGCALLWAPFYAAGDVAARVVHAFGSPVAVDGYSAPYVRAVAYASALYGFLALVLGLLAARRVLGRPLAPTDYAAALAIWWGTPLVFYMYVAPPMSHATSAFAAAAFVYAWIRVRERWSPGGFALLGALAAIMAMVREQDAFFAAGPALDLAWTLIAGTGAHGLAPTASSSRPSPAQGPGDAPPSPRPPVAQGSSPAPPVRLDLRRVALGLAAGAAAFAIVYLPQALAYVTLNGRLGVPHEVSRKMSWSSPHAWQVLASPEHGFLFWTPLAALAIAGLAWIAIDRARRVAGVCLIAMAAAQVYIAGAVESWTVAGAFGQRRFVGLTVLLVIGLAALFERVNARRPRTALLVVAAIATWWNIGLMVQFGSGLMDRQRLELGAITYNNFVAVPLELPELARRYMFARSSFYHPPAPAPDPGR